MDQLTPSHVPVYESDSERRAIWGQCLDRQQPVVAIRDARRGYIVRYDIQHLDAELAPETVRRLRAQTRRWRTYPAGADPVSESEGVGGELGPVSGDLHTANEDEARDLAARLSRHLFDRTNWQ
jgi:hypothetical protein